MGRQPDIGGLRPALHRRQRPALVGGAGRQHRHRRDRLPRLRSDRRVDHPDLWLRQQRRRHRRRRRLDVRHRPAHRLSCRQARPRYRSADARRGLRLSRLDPHLAHLRELHLPAFLGRSHDHGGRAHRHDRHADERRLSGQRPRRHSHRALRHERHHPVPDRDPRHMDRAASRADYLHPLVRPVRAGAMVALHGSAWCARWQRKPALFRLRPLHPSVPAAPDRRAGGLSPLPAQREKKSARANGGRRCWPGGRAGR